MEMADEKWKIAGDLCRCCLAVGSHNKLGIAKFNDKASGDNEDFANMLLENLGLTLLPVKCVLSEITYTICNPCVERLRDAVSFRKQVQLSEEKFWNMYGRNMLIAIEPIVVKVEDVEPEDAYKGASDDDFTMDDFSDDDTKLNFIEIKAETKKSKGKAKAGIKGTATKKPPTRKMAARKTKTKSMMDAESVKAQKQKVKTEKTEAIKTEEEEEGSPAEETKPPVKRKKDNAVFEVPLTTSAVNPLFEAFSAPLDHNMSWTFSSTDPSSSTARFVHTSVVIEQVQIKTEDLDSDEFPEHTAKSKQPPAIKTQSKKTMKSKPKKETKSDALHLSAATTIKNVRKQHRTRKVVKGEFPCSYCGKLYLVKQTLISHISFHHALAKCKHCPLRFTRVKMVDHARSAHSEMLPTCGVCGYQNLTQALVERHQRKVHMKEKKFSCDQCDLTFYNEARMRLHKLTHGNVRAFVCDFCHKGFKQKRTMAMHRKIHTGEKNKVCPICAQAFVQKASLNYHMGKYHPEAKF